MGATDAVLECYIDGRCRQMDIMQFIEEPSKEEDAGLGEKLLIEQVVSINIPELTPYEYSMMYMQMNGPGAMPGCTTTTNGDPSLGGGVIKGIVQFYKAVECLSASIDFLPHDFGYNPDHKERKPAIYLSVKGTDLDDHEVFMDEDK